MKVGYIGLGRMGRGMALNLIKAGYEVVVFDRSADALAAVVGAGARAADSVADLARGVDVVFTSLPGPPEVEEVVFGEDGLLANTKPGQVLFELSTSSRALAIRIEKAFAERGAAMLDASVSGGPAGAESGDMAFWVGGDREVFDRYLPVLRAMGDKPRHCGPIGAGTVVKLVNNVTGHMILLSLAEAFSVGVKAGVEPLELWDALRLGVVGKGSPLNMLTKQFLPGRYDPPAFALKLAYKDVNLATEMARELQVPMRLANMTMADMIEALGRGMGDLDTRSYLQLQLERAGVSIAVDPEEIAKRQGS
ncbi:NAD(P)-dependent oxidoreductase [Amycolatopsis rubida]|uniref:NAD(P)-dependent oxidoreductase n=2 Tax=Pseudonocardiaceae TaxID=2070 RepID=A0ABX0C3D5_9PSEU|nr:MULTISPECIES: NAD(P)-dependent oxidoreductase [Amycolatopsis]MYW96118.1 NAD-binding protein [Amycolatopsis rubida]NEC61109.1 NAD(P)-dependent oxidoreductase [Amycolatopsis rubida]OAP23368.1 2-hydroxy-3-oxopropionate reductase [Amycolatopsis sp. M39]